MKTVFLLYQTDPWHTYASYRLVGVYSTEELAYDAAGKLNLSEGNSSCVVEGIVVDCVPESF